MDQMHIVSGRYADRQFIPDGPLPDIEGSAQLVITAALPQSQGSVAAAFGAAPQLRSGPDILGQARAEREEWGDR
jgi:hypothetical protein